MVPPVKTKPNTLPRPWSQLADQFDGAENLARHFGVSHSTLWRWAHKHIYPLSKVAQIRETFAAHRMESPV